MWRKKVSRCPVITELPDSLGSAVVVMWPGPIESCLREAPSTTIASKLIFGIETVVSSSSGESTGCSDGCAEEALWRSHCASNDRWARYIPQYSAPTYPSSPVPTMVRVSESTLRRKKESERRRKSIAWLDAVTPASIGSGSGYLPSTYRTRAGPSGRDKSSHQNTGADNQEQGQWADDIGRAPGIATANTWRSRRYGRTSAGRRRRRRRLRYEEAQFAAGPGYRNVICVHRFHDESMRARFETVKGVLSFHCMHWILVVQNQLKVVRRRRHWLELIAHSHGIGIDLRARQRRQ